MKNLTCNTLAILTALLIKCNFAFTQTPEWHLVPENPNYPKSEAVVAGFTVDVNTYGTGAVDATNYLQNLLNQLDKAGNRGQNMWNNMELVGGGVLYLPAGRYRIDGKLLIPKGVTIRGDWKKPVKGRPIEGTILMTNQGRNSIKEEDAFMTMQSGAAVMDISIWYPQQNSITPYAPTILMGQPGGPHGNEFCNVKNVTLVNSWDGVIFSQIGGTCPTINGLYGTPLHQGVEIDRIVDIGRIEHIDFSPLYWAYSGLEGAPAHDSPVLREQLYNHATAVVMRRNDWSYTVYLKVEGYNKGFHAVQSRQRDDYGWATPNGHNYGFEFIKCKYGLYFESRTSEGCMFAEVKTAGCEYGAFFSENAGGIAQFYKWDLSATKCAIYTDPQATTKITMMESTVKAGKILLQGGTLLAVNNDFNNAQPQIELEVNSRGDIVGNRFAKEVQILESSLFQNVIDHQPVNMKPLPAYTEFVPQTKKPSGTAFIVATAAPYNARRGKKDDFPISGTTTVTDATNSIQQALTDAGNAGGGIVYLPPGHYRINNQLTIPEGVELKGSMDVSAFPLGPGSVLEVYNRNSVAVVMNANSGIRGINFNYPEQVYCAVMPNPIDFPFSIRGNGDNIYIINVAMRCSNRGVDLFTNSCNNFYIDFLTGYFFREGVNIKNSDHGILANMQCNTIVYNNGEEVKFGQYPNSNRSSSCSSDENKNPYTYNSRNMTFLTLENVNNILLYGDFNYNALVGFHVKSNVNGLALGFALDDDRTMLLLDGSNIYLDFINLQGVALQRGSASDGLSSYIKTTTGYSADCVVNLFNSDYWGYAGESGIVMNGAGTINMYGGNFSHSGVNSFARVNNGYLNVIGSVVNPANNSNATYTGSARSNITTIGSMTNGDSSVNNENGTNITHSPKTQHAGILNDCNTWTATATYTQEGAAQNIVDCNTTNHWSSGWQNQGTGMNSVSVTVDMKTNQTFTQVILEYSGKPSDGPETYVLDISADNTNWTTIATGSGRNSNMTIIAFPPQTARYVRVTKPESKTGNWWAIYNFYVAHVNTTNIDNLAAIDDDTPEIGSDIDIVPVALTGVQLEDAIVQLHKRILLTSIVTPSNATNRSVTFSVISGNDKISLDPLAGWVTGVAIGTAQVRVTTADGGFTATATISVTLDCDPIKTVRIRDRGGFDGGVNKPEAYLRVSETGGLIWSDIADENSAWYEIPVGKSTAYFYYKNVGTNQYLYRETTGKESAECEWTWESARLSESNSKTGFFIFHKMNTHWSSRYWLINMAEADLNNLFSKGAFVLSGINKNHTTCDMPDHPAVVMTALPNDNNVWHSVSFQTISADVTNPDCEEDKCDIIITRHPKSNEYLMGDVAKTLTVTATGAELSYRWFDSNNTQVGENATFTPNVSASGVSSYYVKVSNDLCEKTSDAAVITVTTITSVSSEASDSEIIVYPNPTSGIIYLNTPADIRVYNMQGILLKTTFGSQADLSEYPAGIYLLQINNCEWRKVLKQ